MINSWEKLALEILEDNAFEKDAFVEWQGAVVRYDIQNIVGHLVDILQRQYVSVEVEKILADNKKEEIVDFLNRLIESKLKYRMHYNNQISLITIGELEEFMKLAEQTDKLPKEELSKAANLLTTRSYLDMCRIVYDAISEWKYPSDISTAYLFCDARAFDFKHEYEHGILGAEWDSAEQFACRFNGSYHNEELRFGGPKLYIDDESSRVGKNVYTSPRIYGQWTGCVCCRVYDIKAVYQAIKMYNALRKEGYPIYFFKYEEAYWKAKESLQ